MNYIHLLKSDLRFIEGMRACINCGTCTAICPAAQYYDYDPRAITEIVQRKDEAEIENILKSNLIWYCGECLSCKTRCPRENVPAYIIQALKKVSIETGLFIESEKGRQQLAIIRTIGKHILENGYCVYLDNINTEMFPEQGPVWDWIKENIALISKQIGLNYKGDGSGSLRKIPEESIKEINVIFEVTGGKSFFDLIEEKSKEYANQNNLSFEKGEIDSYFNIIYNGQ